MSATSALKAPTAAARGAVEIARELGSVLADRANAATDEDKYVADNIALLKTSGLVEAGVPRELGGGGADVDELAAMLRTLAYHCGSTGLTFSMHTHQVAIPAWRWKHQKAAAGRAPPEADCQRAHPAALERRVGLDRRLRQGGKGGGRLSHKRPQGLHLRSAHRRHLHDGGHPRNGRRAADGAALRRAHELPAREGARYMAHARHARHRLARRA